MAVSEPTNGAAVSKAGGLPPEEIIFGRTGSMISIRQKVQKVLGTDVPILIQGENGTGKGLLAQYIHSRSAMCSGAFVKVNCAAIPGALLESELFGYEKGSFTDAHTSKPGYVEMANRGTLFLDEIADLDLKLQAKVLQLLQDGHFSRIGDKQERQAEIRVICATNRDLQAEIDAGHFRHDLFYRDQRHQYPIAELARTAGGHQAAGKVLSGTVECAVRARYASLLRRGHPEFVEPGMARKHSRTRECGGALFDSGFARHG